MGEIELILKYASDDLISFCRKRHGVRQPDDYSCAVACVLTVLKILGRPTPTYEMMRQRLQPHPETGTDHKNLERICRTLLPGLTAGERTYRGGLAIANIIEDFGEGQEGHYVVFLGIKDQQIYYYCPYQHRLISKLLRDLDWRAQFTPVRRWSINFDHI